VNDIERFEETVISDDHWIIDRREISKVVSVLSDISNRSMDSVSNCVRLTAWKGNKIRLQYTDGDIYFKCLFDLINLENQFKKDFSVILDLRQLNSVLKFSPKFMLSMDDNKNVYAHLMNGTYHMDVLSFSEDLFTLNYKEKKDLKVYGLYDTSEFLRSAVSLMDLATSYEDKKLIVKDGYAYGSFISTLTRQTTIFPDMVLRFADIKNLQKIIDIFEDEFRISVGKERLMIRGRDWVYSSLVIDGDVADDIIKKFEDGKEEDTVVDGSLLQTIFQFLSLSGSDSAGVVLFCDRSVVDLIYTSHTGKQSVYRISDDCQVQFNVSLLVSQSRKIFHTLGLFPTIYLNYEGNYIKYTTADYSISVIQGVTKA
jgi:hypothetical protein